MIIICAAVGMIAFPTVLPSQDYVNTPVTISKDKVKKDGVTYYSHIVLERQTLYSISKAYEVSLDDIYAANPGLRENGLKTNSIILIPVASKSAAPAVSDSPAQENAPENTVATPSGEDNSVSADNTTDYDNTGGSNKKKSKREYFTHTVKWYEDLETIAEKYKMPASVIIYYNNLTSREVTRKQQLKIPFNPENYVVEAAEAVKNLLASEELSDSEVDAAQDSTLLHQADEKMAKRDSGPKDNVSAVIMLPFNSTGTNPSAISMDFYSGALIAAKELGEKGLNIDLSVYDVYGDVLPITVERLEKSDFVVGPLSSDGLSALLEKADGCTYVISPLDSRTESLSNENSNFIQVPVSQNAQYEDLIKWISEETTPEDRVVVIYEKGRADNFEDEFNKMVGESDIDWQFFSYGILEGRNITRSLSAKLTETGVNRFLVVSDSEAFVNDVIRNINLLIHNKFNVVLFGEIKIRTFETIDVDNLHTANFHCSASYYINYDDPKVQSFLLQYRALCNTEPSQSAFQGYDIMWYFATMCARYGDFWTDHITERNTPMLMSDFHFGKSGEGYIRTAIRRAVFNEDYSVSLIE